MRSFCGEPGWFEQCKAAIDHALNIRRQFMDDALDFVLEKRLHGLLERVRGEHSLVSKNATASDFVNSRTAAGAPTSGLYSNRVEHLNIEFSVNRVDFGAEVFDVRLVSIKPRSNTEHHRHGHESLLTVTRGKGRAMLAVFSVEVSAGDMGSVPPCAMHLTR